MKTISMHDVEDWLPESMKTLKRAALAGDVESEFNIGLLYGNLGHHENDTNAVNIGMRWIARAAKKGHAQAISFLSNAGINWRNYDY
jgi:TPR repeat protein